MSKDLPLPLRERKKHQTALMLQRAAIRLFNQQGYAKTTVEQIVAEAQVSVSTFFRYFSSKELVVSYGFYDGLIIEAFKNQPRSVSTIRALRNSISEVYQSLPKAAVDEEHQRFVCMQNDPHLRAAIVANLANSQPNIAKWLISHTKDEEEANLLAGIFIGVGVAILLNPSSQNYVERFDEALQKVELRIPGL
jgi:AcrR family transcriptional regulator